MDDEHDHDEEEEAVVLVPQHMMFGGPTPEQVARYQMQQAAEIQHKRELHVWLATLDTDTQRKFLEILAAVSSEITGDEGPIQYWIGLIRGSFAMKGLCPCCGEDHFAQELDEATKEKPNGDG